MFIARLYFSVLLSLVTGGVVLMLDPHSSCAEAPPQLAPAPRDTPSTQAPPSGLPFFTKNRLQALKLFQAGKAAFRAGSYLEAARLFQKAITLHPDLDVVYYHLGLTQSKLGKKKDAAESFLRAIDANPSLWEAHLELATHYESSGQAPLAMAHYREVVRINPEITRAHFRLAGLLTDAGKLEDAQKEYREVVRLQPQSVAGWYNLGFVLSQLRKPKEAVEAFETVLGSAPDHADAHMGAGIMRAALGDRAPAVRHLLKARRLFAAQGNEAKANLAEKYLLEIRETNPSAP